MLTSGKLIEVSLERVFIPSKLWDNPRLLDNQPQYVLQLKQTGSEALVKAWLDGNWDMIQGAYFDDFDPTRHIISSETPLPKHWTRFRAMDWGSARPFCVGWYAVSDGSGNFPRDALIKYREFYGWNGNPNVGLKMNAAAVAEAINQRDELDRKAGLRPQLWPRRPLDLHRRRRPFYRGDDAFPRVPVGSRRQQAHPRLAADACSTAG
jgi:hypothetical protein